ncbi:MAG: hypothetical protein QM571_03395 [Micrococcaceae bacterium]
MARDIIEEVALDNYGFITTKDAVEAGVPAIELPKLAERGGLKNIAYGIYRVSNIPSTPYDQFAEGLLRVGEGACLYGESVLALFGLANVNSRKVKIATTRRARPKLPPYIELTKIKSRVPTTFYEGLCSQTVTDAIISCRGRIENERLKKAAQQARVEVLLTTVEWELVMKDLKHGL